MFNAHKMSFRTMEWSEILSKIPDGYFDHLHVATVEQSVDMLKQILAFNKIDFLSFVNNVYDVVEKRRQKLNSLVITGPPNAGKTLVISSICRSLLYYSACQSFSGTSSFEFQDMISSRAALINEPCFTDKTIETIKNLFEGQPVAIDVKHKSGQVLPRTPMFVTTNTDLAFYTTRRTVNGEALKARGFYYVFKDFSNLAGFHFQLNPMMWKYIIDEYIE